MVNVPALSIDLIPSESSVHRGWLDFLPENVPVSLSSVDLLACLFFSCGVCALPNHCVISILIAS